MVKGHIVREDDASLIPWIDKNGFETFEREAAEQRARPSLPLPSSRRKGATQ